MVGPLRHAQNFVFYLTVHPLDEPLDKPCQCTRHRFKGRAEYDQQRREKLTAEAQGSMSSPNWAAERAEVLAHVSNYRTPDYRRGELAQPLMYTRTV